MSTKNVRNFRNTPTFAVFHLFFAVFSSAKIAFLRASFVILAGKKMAKKTKKRKKRKKRKKKKKRDKVPKKGGGGVKGRGGKIAALNAVGATPPAWPLKRRASLHTCHRVTVTYIGDKMGIVRGAIYM